jgi:hypothetical protein
MVGLLSILKEFITDQEFQRLTVFVFFILIGGAAFYHYTEGWGWLDSVYFCATTLTTVGYGDLAPSTGASKFFTIFYILIGIGILLGYISVVAKIAVKHKFGLVGLITEKTKVVGERTMQLGEKTMQLGKKVHKTEPEPVVEEEKEVKPKPPRRRPPMKKYEFERLK